MKKSIVLIPLPSLIKNSFVRSFVLLFELRLIGVMPKTRVGGKVGLIAALRKHPLSYCGFV